jgi:hypothetical protein
VNAGEEAVALLREIRDTQKLALDEQRAYRAAFEAHLAESRARIVESIALQRATIGGRGRHR